MSSNLYHLRKPRIVSPLNLSLRKCVFICLIIICHCITRYFFKSFQWHWHPGIYITYRVIVACYSIACLIAIEIAQGTVDSLAYLTIWTYTVLCLYQVTSLLACIFCLVCGGGNPRAPSERSTLVKTHANENNAVEAVRNLGYLEESVNNSHSSNGKVSTISRDADGNYNVDNRSTASATDLNDPRMNRTCWYMKVTWCLADVVYTFGIIVTLVYFTALFPYIGVTSGFIHDLNVHAANTDRYSHCCQTCSLATCFIPIAVWRYLRDFQYYLLVSRQSE